MEAKKCTRHTASQVIDKSFSSRIMLKLGEQDMSLSELANRAMVSRSVLYDYIEGTRRPSSWAVKKIATVLQVKIDWLLGLED